MKKGSSVKFIVVVTLIALLVRLVDLNKSSFIGDFGFYYLQVRDILLGNNLPLVGIPSSVPVLRQGAIWTYLLAGALWVGDFHPLSGVILSVGLGIIAVILTYFITTKLFDRQIAILASLIAATFPFIVLMDRNPFQTAAIFPATVTFAYLTHRVYLKTTLVNSFILGLCWALLFQLELAAIILVPIVTLVYLIKQYEFKIKYLISVASGTLWGLVPFLVYDLQNGVFIQTVGFGVWFFSKVYENGVHILILLFLISIFQKQRRNLKNVDFKIILASLWSLVGILSFWLRGSFSDAYIPLIYYPLIIIASIVFSYFRKTHKLLGTLLFSVFIFCSILSTINKINTQSQSEFGLSEQMELAKYITNDAITNEINIVYLGPNMQFETGDDNYEYLLWYFGGKINKDSNLKYAIIYESYSEPEGYREIKNFSGVRVDKKYE